MNIDRRSFVKTAASLGVGSVLPFASDMATTAKEVLRIGFLGTGLRGQDHLAAILKRKDCRVVAICDIDPVMLGRTREIIKEHGASLPTIYD